jgi:hypothetical protein
MCDGQSIITRNDVEPRPCTDDHPDEPPHVICKASPQLYPLHTLPASIVMRCQPVECESHSFFWVGLERL